jgi:hypothetical protein
LLSAPPPDIVSPNMAPRKKDELARVLGTRPPAGLRALKLEDRAHLAAAIESAHERQIAAVAEATDKALKHVPRPLRGTVRRLFADN